MTNYGKVQLWVFWWLCNEIRGKNGAFIINNGVTRAFRVAKLIPGQLVPVEVIDDLPNWDISVFPTVGDKLP